MNDDIKKFVKSTISDLITNTSSNKKIAKLTKTHTAKIHFIPIRYRIFNGLLQSMNIQFGNFIEKLLHKIVESENDLKVNENSGKKIKLPLTKTSNDLIDQYITKCQNSNANENELLENFNDLIDKCLKNEKNNNLKEVNETHDIDVLFSNKNGKIFYLEVKYNDDHDTDRFSALNRKFIKSYIGVCNILEIYDKNKIKPILYYLNKKKMKGNIYTPEQENIYRGDKLFKEFFTIDYKKLDGLMKNIGDDSDIVELFDNLHRKIRFKLDI